MDILSRIVDPLFSPRQQLLADYIVRKLNSKEQFFLFLHGRAGYRKTWFISIVFTHLGFRCRLMAMTNAIALDLRVPTLHKEMQYPVDMLNVRPIHHAYNPSLAMIVIEEASMFQGAMFPFTDEALRQIKRNQRMYGYRRIQCDPWANSSL